MSASIETFDNDLLPSVPWETLPALSLHTLNEVGAANPVDMMLADLASPNTKRTYETQLKNIARLLPISMDVRAVPWQNLRYEHAVAIKAALAESGRSPASINAAIAALRKVTDVCVKLRLMTRGDMQGVHDVKSLRVSRLPSGREVRIGELEAIIRACREAPHPASTWRDIAVIGFLFIGGLRRFEVASINVEHLDLESGSLTFIGKGNKERRAFLDPGTSTAVDYWLSCRGGFEGPLFLQVNKSGKILYDSGRISGQAVYNIVKHRQKQAGVTSCSPHDFRRTFGTELLRQGIDLPTVQRLMGHADPSTTARYDVRDSEEDRRATRGLHLPIGKTDI